jgi:malate dehydrogenase (oxaloacetate-decarboxylating)
LTTKEDAINLHRMLRGKIEIQNRVPIDSVFEQDKGTLGLIYTPGVAYVATEIGKNKALANEYTSKWNNVAIVCDGSRVLGLGNVGPEAAIPVMEGKSVLFKVLAGINAFPLCIATQDKEEIIQFVKAIQPVFGAINIEDIESPKVLEIVERLENDLLIPVFHDDQHGTAVITLAALLNSLRLLHKKINEVSIFISGAGSAGYGIFKIMLEAGCRDIIVADSKGAIYYDRNEGIDSPYKKEIAKKSNPRQLRGKTADTIKGIDVFIGVSGRREILDYKMVQSMSSDPIIFALSNPDPEILPSEAFKGGAKIVATGRSDFPNQVNNAVVFPSILRALLDLQVRDLRENVLAAIANAIAGLVDDEQLKEDFIIPKINDPRIQSIITQTLKEALLKHIEKGDRKLA